LSDSGAYGIVFVLNWKPQPIRGKSGVSPYYKLDSDKQEVNIEQIVIKVVGITNTGLRTWNYIDKAKKNASKNPETVDSVKRESELHELICKSSSLQLCPSFIHSRIYHKANGIEILNKLLQRCVETGEQNKTCVEQMQQIINALKDSKPKSRSRLKSQSRSKTRPIQY
jgi:hypothetical protein